MSLVQDDATHDETQIRALILQGDQAHRDKDAPPLSRLMPQTPWSQTWLRRFSTGE
jgi:hypothetical protein